jgi:hypothetical protein
MALVAHVREVLLVDFLILMFMQYFGEDALNP